MLNRRFISKEEWKNSYISTRFILPFLLFISIVNVMLGSWDGFYLFITSVILFIFVIKYTKRKTKSKYDTEKKYIKGKAIKITLDVILILFSILIITDNIKYTVVMSQVQFENSGYTVGSIQSGGFEGNIYIDEKDGDNRYRHVFEGWKYLSKVELDEEE